MCDICQNEGFDRGYVSALDVVEDWLREPDATVDSVLVQVKRVAAAHD